MRKHVFLQITEYIQMTYPLSGLGKGEEKKVFSKLAWTLLLPPPKNVIFLKKIKN